MTLASPPANFMEQSPMHEFSNRRCWFWMPCMQSRDVHLESNWWQPIGSIKDGGDNNKWWSKGLVPFKKLKEWSELVAGPKWKTFIRRFSKKRSKHNSVFKYDPASYSLNFDEGGGRYVEDDQDLFFRDFSSRYTSVPVSTKSSMDLGKDGLSFT